MKTFLSRLSIPSGPPSSSLLLLPLLLLFQTSCAKTTFIPVENGQRTVGKGAILRKVDGIDIWSDGQPPRPYRIIGVIHDRRNGLRKGDLLKDVAHAAKKMKGDAILEYQAYGATSGGVTAGAASLTGNTLMLGALASGPAVTFVGPLAAAVAATTGGASRWWVAKYVPEKPKAAAAKSKAGLSPPPRQAAAPLAPRSPSVPASTEPSAE